MRQRAAQGWDFRTPFMWLSPPRWDKKGSHVRASKATPPRFRTREDKANPGGQVQGLRPARTRFDRRGRMWGPCKGVTKCRHRPCVIKWISTQRKSPVTSTSTELGGVNGSMSGSCFLLIRMLYVGYSFAICLLLIFGLSTISGFLIEIFSQAFHHFTITLAYYCCS